MESDGRVVQLSGRLDASTTAELRAALGAIDREARSGDLVVLDLAGIDHADATGLAPLVLARRRARARAYVLALAAPSPAVVAVMTRTHLTGAFRIVTPRDQAVAQPA